MQRLPPVMTWRRSYRGCGGASALLGPAQSRGRWAPVGLGVQAFELPAFARSGRALGDEALVEVRAGGERGADPGGEGLLALHHLHLRLALAQVFAEPGQGQVPGELEETHLGGADGPLAR